MTNSPRNRSKSRHSWLPWTGLREHLRTSFFRLLRRALTTDDGKAAATDALAGLLRTAPEDFRDLTRIESPYAELGKPAGPDIIAHRDDVILITARFRSGSTLLWNLFRHVDGCTAYYEPLNERRWFDPSTRGSQTDASHRQVADYWREYEGLTVLNQYYRENWIDRQLYMDANCWAPDFKRYLELLIEHAPGRPVLQFNRIDFRLPWFRRTFPRAKIVHIYRHPRDQWCSMLMDIGCFGKDMTLDEFAPHDKFYLLRWGSDLKYHFPFLAESASGHPYELHYYLWKLSYLFGAHCADASLKYEDLVANPESTLDQLFHLLGVDHYDSARLRQLIDPPQLGRWRTYADDAWFRRIETHCETVLADFLGVRPTKAQPAPYTVLFGSDR